MKSTLIFLHGGPGFQDYLKPFFTSLEDKFNCVFYDQVRGSQTQLEDMLSQLDELVRSLPGKKVLVGHSWGAILATEYAAREQSKLAGLVLISTGLNHKHWKDEYRKELANLGLEDAGPEQIFLAPDEVKKGASFLEQSWQTFSGETFDSINDSYLSNYDVTEKIGTIQIPIINIFGELDVRFPTRITKTFRNYNSKINDFQISKAGHFPFLRTAGRDQIYKILENYFLGKPIE